MMASTVKPSGRPSIFQAIVTKYLGPTNTRGSRIKATATAGSVTISCDHALSIEERHAKAAIALANRFGWSGSWHQGGMPNGRGYVFVPVEGGAAFTTEREG